MARKPRIEYDGAVYHIMCRAIHGVKIFTRQDQMDLWLGTLGQACERTGWVVHAYVVMNNHYHALVETREANLVAGMKWFQGTFTQRYNAGEKRWGHLYQGRYKALVVDGHSGGYFGRVSTYIHLNPVRAGLVDGGKKLSRYGWSSLGWCLTEKKCVLAWMLKGCTVMSNGWIAQRLMMGHPHNVPWCVKKVEETQSGRINEWRKKLTRISED